MEGWKDVTTVTPQRVPSRRNKLQKCVSRQASNSRRPESPRIVNTTITYLPLEKVNDPGFLTQPRLAPPPPPRPTESETKRRKTSSAGVLEAIQPFSNTLSRTSSVDLIAGQYHDLLEFRDSSEYPYTPLPPSRDSSEGTLDDLDEWIMLPQRRNGDHHQNETPTGGDSECTVELPDPSPNSEARGTPPSRRDEKVYFKPVSYSPQTEQGQVQERELGPSSIPIRLKTSPDNHTPNHTALQTSLRLLTDDLSSAMARRPGDSAKWMSLTQIRFMIQAYERLRDQISEGNQCDPSQATALQDMFDMWLRALYRIHWDIQKEARAQFHNTV